MRVNGLPPARSAHSFAVDRRVLHDIAISVAVFRHLLAIVASVPATAQDRKEREFQECTDCPVMVGIPAGNFVMGSPADEPGRFDAEGPQHRVAIRAFALGKFDVTTAQFLTFLRETGYQPAPCNKTLTLGWQSPGNGHAYPRSDAEPPTWPATCVGWKDAHGLYRLAERQGSRRASRAGEARRSLSLAQRSGMGICRARRHDDVALVGQCGRNEQCQLQWLRQQVRRSRADRCRQLRAQSVRPLRHARQCLAVDGGLLAQELCRRADATAAPGSATTAASTSCAAARGTMFRSSCARRRARRRARTRTRTTIPVSPAFASRVLFPDAATAARRAD